MEYFPHPLSRTESDQLANKIQARIQENGWGLWAVTAVGTAQFIGFIGLNSPAFSAHFTPAIEIGWRLAYPFWRRGYATEGASACLHYGFTQLGLTEIVSFTSSQNKRSRAVMERLGMHHNPKDNFDFPTLPQGHPLQKHVLYRLSSKEWRKKTL